jgi:uncharacterized protein
MLELWPPDRKGRFDMAERGIADAAWWQKGGGGPAGRPAAMKTSSCYLEMRDGVRLAIDVHVPGWLPPAGRVPTILHQTRYYRRTLARWPFGRLMASRDLLTRFFRRFSAGGYAIVNVDVRGTGASFGARQMELSPEEVKDGAEVTDWIVRQSWSDGQVATMGMSYTGMAAELALTNRHPAIKAAVIQYAMFDIYPDILSPGGVRSESFVRDWSALNAALDRNELKTYARREIGRLAGLAIKGVAPVDEDAGGAMLQQAVMAHAGNYGIYTASLDVEFRDDGTNSGITLDDFSPHRRILAIGPGVPIYAWSGWYDGACTMAAATRFLNLRTPGSRLILGPWDHGGRQNPDPFVPDHRTRFDHAGEILRFLDFHLRGTPTGVQGETPVHYFTMGEEAWKAADTWPPPGFAPTPYYFSANRRLTEEAPPPGDGSDHWQIDYAASSGRASRWVSQVNVRQVQIGYPDRKQQDTRLLVYTSAPLDRDVEVTGDPEVRLFIRASSPDAQFFVYLEDVWPDGAVFYVTEGAFRALHRRAGCGAPSYRAHMPYHTFRRGDALPLVPGDVAELAFHLQPISYLFQRGHAVRVAIAGADKDNFALVPPSPPAIEVLRCPAHPSHVVLPVKR